MDRDVLRCRSRAGRERVRQVSEVDLAPAVSALPFSVFLSFGVDHVRFPANFIFGVKK
jgi:hypothetical protein